MFVHRGLALAAVAAVITTIAGGNALAQSAFSDKVIQQIEEARTAARARSYQEALDIYSRAVDDAIASITGSTGADGTIRKLLVDRATLYENLRLLPKAEADFTSALSVRPVDPNAYADRGYFYMRQNRMPDALSDFMSGTRLAPDSAKFYYGAGRVQTALENYSAAIDFYTDAISADPSGARAFLARGEAKLRLGEWAEARADYDRALALGMPRSSDVYYARLGRGYVQMMQGDYATGVADFTVALDINPAAARVLLWRGYANEQRGRRDLAIADYERAAAVDRRDTVARQNLERLRSLSTAAVAPPGGGKTATD